MEMMFLLNYSLCVLQNKFILLFILIYIALVGISLKMVFLYKFELAKMAPNSVNTHLNFFITNSRYGTDYELIYIGMNVLKVHIG